MWYLRLNNKYKYLTKKISNLILGWIVFYCIVLYGTYLLFKSPFGKEHLNQWVKWKKICL